ncbi:MAG: helix-turn-helix domain-containing protein [Eubacterium sp.]|nr:helix-turn-helix domain-containing protein [Eubacterium sp.]
MRIKMKHEDELLVVPQVAYLLGRSRSSTEKLVITGALLAVDGKNRRLIKASELKRYVENQVKKYERVAEWERAEDKGKYWEQSGYRGSQTITKGYLTIPQTAFLLQRSRQGVNYLCQNGFLHITYVPMQRGQQGRFRKLVDVESLINYEKSKMERFQKAINYFTCEDTYYFWNSSEKDFEETFFRKERERYKKREKV